MVNFGEIYSAALTLKGSDLIEDRMLTCRDDQQFAAMADSFFLSNMSRRIFRAGLKHSMVDKKWPHFEEVFSDFDIQAVRLMSNDDLDLLMQDSGLIRHWGKLNAVRQNAEVIHEIKQEAGSFGAFLGDWKSSRIVELWQFMTRNFKQLGGNSAPYFLRMVGKDTFVLTNDVLRALHHWNVYDGKGKSMADRKYLQSCFNSWSEESGKPLCQVSQIVALSIES